MILGLFGSPGLNNWPMMRLETLFSWTRFPQGYRAIVETQVSTGLHGDQSLKKRPKLSQSHLDSGDLHPYMRRPKTIAMTVVLPHFPHTQPWEPAGKVRHYSQETQAVTHPSANLAKPCFTSKITLAGPYYVL